ncbi:UTP--glucose-1-phosphate uridylyltransferase-like isoform X1 [Varroa destructor]|uniref:UTP--glucose-1-phosphate uridylyltransferase n=2 Tax=Varroa destructor TaxID=109461 RepID=A0A7M7JYE5_VARDE|nr:UTP--glucose-1-phosphate uridylyltransferase-like isoform X1 [Varroa destructor]XP_022657496.1 UTP--glucose-1-phosphate uridylyltransferase-like isoform X1 [Varroa destructor]
MANIQRAQRKGISSMFGGAKDDAVRKISEVSQFKQLTKKDAQVLMLNEIEKLITTCQSNEKEGVEEELHRFQRLFTRFLTSSKPIDWDRITALPPDAIRDYADLPKPSADVVQDLLSKLVVVKLNGGLGTSMGCQGPKSAIPVRNDLTFLDLTVQQIENLNATYGCDVPLVLMNSFNTEDDTIQILRKYKGFNVNIFTFLQSRFPRIHKDTLMPLAKTLADKDNDESFYPPGHGDFYESFCQSGLLKHFLNQGREYVFMSNIDNMGATVDLNILSFLLSSNDKPGFVMEVTEKTRADVKGGTLINYGDHIRLLEIAQVPPDHVDEFKSVKKFKIFNTNNLWIRLEEIENIVESGSLELEVIVNPKTLSNGVNVLQLETAAGAAINHFGHAFGIIVPRSRFLPVKKTSDLMLAMSNLYTMSNGTLTMSPLRAFPTVPFVKLGDKHFSKVRDFLSRFSSIPDILELDHLTVSGDVTFGKGVVLRGTVIIIANHGDRIDVPEGAILENKIMSGNLRILTH